MPSVFSFRCDHWVISFLLLSYLSFTTVSSEIATFLPGSLQVVDVVPYFPPGLWLTMTTLSFPRLDHHTPHK